MASPGEDGFDAALEQRRWAEAKGCCFPERLSRSNGLEHSEETQRLRMRRLLQKVLKAGVTGVGFGTGGGPHTCFVGAGKAILITFQPFRVVLSSEILL